MNPKRNIDKRVGGRVTEAEKMMAQAMARDMQCSENDAVRWAIRYAYMHAHASTCTASCLHASDAIFGRPVQSLAVEEEEEDGDEVNYQEMVKKTFTRSME